MDHKRVAKIKNAFFNSVLLILVLLVTSCGKQSEIKIDVMSFNIRLDHVADGSNNWKYRSDNVVQMFSYYSPDILGLQEVLKNQLDDLKKFLPEYINIGVGRADGKEMGEYCPIFFKAERFKLLKNGDFALSENPDSIGDKGWDAACERIVTWAVLKDKKSSKEIAVFNTHFDHVGEVARRESAKLLINKIKELAVSCPVIITGDFNGTLDSEPVSILTEDGMKNAFNTAKVVYGPSWSFHNFGSIPIDKRRLIDFIFVNEEIEVERYRTVDDKPDDGYLSDHAPVMAILKI